MRNFIKTSMMLIFAFMTSFVMNAQQEFENSNIRIFQELVDGKFDQIKAQAGNIEIIFRNDRLEIFENVSGQNEEKQSFLFFDNATKVQPQPVGLISSEVKALKNHNMSQVLGVSEMNVNNYESVIYENLYKGADLIIEIGETSLNFTIINKSSASTIPFSISSWNEEDLVKINNIIKHKDHDNIEIASAKSQMAVAGRELNFVSSNKEANNNISFTLNFLN